MPACVFPTTISNGGTAQITHADPTASACETFLAYNSGTSGNLTVNGGTLHTCNELHVGEAGAGKLTITNGGPVSTTFGADIGAVAGSSGSVSVDGANSQWTISGTLYLAGTINGDGGTGLLTVTNSGTVTAANVHLYKPGTLAGNATVSTTNGTTVDGTVSPNRLGWGFLLPGNRF